MDTAVERVGDFSGDPVAQLAQSLVCAILAGKDGRVAERNEVEAEASEAIHWVLSVIRSHGFAEYDGVDLRLTDKGVEKASAHVPLPTDAESA